MVIFTFIFSLQIIKPKQKTVTVEKKVNGQSSPKASIDPELVKTLGLSGKGMPNIKGVIKVDPKHMPNLSTGTRQSLYLCFTILLSARNRPGQACKNP